MERAGTRTLREKFESDLKYLEQQQAEIEERLDFDDLSPMVEHVYINLIKKIKLMKYRYKAALETMSEEELSVLVPDPSPRTKEE